MFGGVATNITDESDLDGCGQTDEVDQRRPPQPQQRPMDVDGANGAMFQSPLPGRDRRERDDNVENVKNLKVNRMEGDTPIDGIIVDAWKDHLSRTRFKFKFDDDKVLELGVNEVKGLLLNVHNRQTVNEKIAV